MYFESYTPPHGGRLHTHTPQRTAPPPRDTHTFHTTPDTKYTLKPLLERTRIHCTHAYITHTTLNMACCRSPAHLTDTCIYHIITHSATYAQHKKPQCINRPMLHPLCTNMNNHMYSHLSALDMCICHTRQKSHPHLTH